MRRLLLALGAVVLSACNTTIDATRYAQTCAVDADCTVVFSGELCVVCGGCGNAAINVSAKAKFDADAKALHDSCPPRFGPIPSCAPCQQRAAVCTAGACQVAPN